MALYLMGLGGLASQHSPFSSWKESMLEGLRPSKLPCAGDRVRPAYLTIIHIILFQPTQLQLTGRMNSHRAHAQ